MQLEELKWDFTVFKTHIYTSLNTWITFADAMVHFIVKGAPHTLSIWRWEYDGLSVRSITCNALEVFPFSFFTSYHRPPTTSTLCATFVPLFCSALSKSFNSPIGVARFSFLFRLLTDKDPAKIAIGSGWRAPRLHWRQWHGGGSECGCELRSPHVRVCL